MVVGCWLGVGWLVVVVVVGREKGGKRGGKKGRKKRGVILPCQNGYYDSNIEPNN